MKTLVVVFLLLGFVTVAEAVEIETIYPPDGTPVTCVESANTVVCY